MSKFVAHVASILGPFWYLPGDFKSSIPIVSKFVAHIASILGPFLYYPANRKNLKLTSLRSGLRPELRSARIKTNTQHNGKIQSQNFANLIGDTQQ